MSIKCDNLLQCFRPNLDYLKLKMMHELYWIVLQIRNTSLISLISTHNFRHFYFEYFYNTILFTTLYHLVVLYEPRHNANKTSIKQSGQSHRDSWTGGNASSTPSSCSHQCAINQSQTTQTKIQIKNMHCHNCSHAVILISPQQQKGHNDFKNMDSF